MNEPATSADSEFRELARTGSRELRAKLIADHLDMARRLARRFTRRGDGFDDLFQVASLGLVKAVDGFNPELGYDFEAYAVTTILGELKRYFRDQGWSVRAPRRLQELYLRIRQASDELAQQLGRVPSTLDLAHHLETDEESVLEALEAARGYRSSSLDASYEDTGAPALQLGAEDPRFEITESLVSVRSALQALPAREWRILALRFFHDQTQSEIAKEVGLSQMQISRLLDRSLRKLRAAQEAEEPIDDALPSRRAS